MVFFMHGILDTAMGWVCNGVTGSNAVAAYDAGYDVWLGNSRANPPRLHMGEYMCCCTNLDLCYMHTLKGVSDVSTGCSVGPICARCSGCLCDAVCRPVKAGLSVLALLHQRAGHGGHCRPGARLLRLKVAALTVAAQALTVAAFLCCAS